MAARDVITKANLQYYDGKLKQEIAKKGDVKEIRFHGKSTKINTERYFEEDAIYEFDPNNDDLVKRYAGDDSAAWGYTNAVISESSGDTRDRDSISINYKRDTGINKYHISFTRYGVNDDTAYVYHNKDYKIPLKDNVDSIFAAAAGHKFKEISTTQFPTIETFLDLQSTNWDATGEGYMSHSDRREDTIYLYPKTENGVRYFDEYLYEPGEPPAGPGDGGVAPSFEFLGTLKQDLTGYVKEEDIPETDNDYIDGLFLRNLEPGVYRTDGTMRCSWNDLVNGGGNVGLSYPIVNLNNTGDTILSVNASGWNDVISESGPTLIVPSNIAIVSTAEVSNSSHMPGLQQLSDLQTIYFKNPSVNLTYPIGSTQNNNPFKSCVSLRRIYYRGSDVPNFWFSTGGCPNAKIIKI